MKTAINIILAAVGAMAILAAAGALLDGPSDADIERATAADLADAKAAARHRAQLGQAQRTPARGQELWPADGLPLRGGVDREGQRQTR